MNQHDPNPLARPRITETRRSRPRGWGACLAALLLCLVPGFAQIGTSPLEGQLIGDIVVKGNQNTDRAFVLSRMKSKVGRPYDADSLDGDVKRLFNTGYFNDVETKAERASLAKGTIRITVVVVENQIVSRVLFEGRKRVRREVLTEVVRTQEGTFLDPADLTQDARRIEEVYLSRGYYHVSVTFERKKVADGVDVFFNISEGPRVSIRKIEITGNEGVESKLLKKIMLTKQSIFILSTSSYDEDKLQGDIINIRRYYRDEGYLDVKADLADVVVSEDKKKIDLLIKVEEGDRYKVRNIELKGMTLFDSEKVLGVLFLKKGDWFRTENLVKDRDGLKQVYGDAGFLFAEARISTTYAGATPEIDVTLDVVENEAVRIGLVHVVGNVETKDKVIRRDLEFFPHERASITRIKRSVARLHSRDYYESVDYEFSETDDPNVRDATIEVVEKATGKAKFGVGVTSNQGLVGEVSVSKQNFDLLDLPKSLEDLLSGTAFTGAGQFLLFEVQPGTEVNRFRVSFQEPYLFDKPISLTLGGFFFRRDRDEYTEERLGGNVALGKRITRDMGVELGYQWQDIMVDSIGSFAAEDIADVAGSNVISALRLSMGIDKRDNPVNSTKGWRTGATAEMFGGPLGGDFDFFRIGANWSTYWTLLRDSKERPFVLSATAKTGAIATFDDTTEAPVFERYFAGGSGSLRGFDFRGIGPMQNGDAVGGEAEFLAAVQLTFPIYEELLRGAVFVDVGSVAVDYGDLFSTMRASVGAGLLVSVPFLGPKPLEFSFAIPIASERGDIEQVFNFSLGRDL